MSTRADTRQRPQPEEPLGQLTAVQLPSYHGLVSSPVMLPEKPDAERLHASSSPDGSKVLEMGLQIGMMDPPV